MSLTPRQLRVAELVSQGFTDKQIARRLGCTVSTVKYHLAEVNKHVPQGEGQNARVRLALWYVTTWEDSDAA